MSARIVIENSNRCLVSFADVINSVIYRCN